jgi:DNA-binding IclR family transcriptional regulator
MSHTPAAPDPPAPARTQTQSVSRALDILLCFSSEKPTWTQIELSRRLGLYKSTVHRLLLDLAARGLVWEDPETKQFQLGARLVDLGRVVREFHPLRQAAFGVMLDVVQAAGETVALHVREGPDVYCLERIESSARVRLGARIGAPVPLYAGSSARAILAFLPDAEIQRLLDKPGIKPFRGRRLMSKARLLASVAEARRRGYTVSFEEIGPGAAGISVPILSAGGAVLGSLSILSPIDRLQPARVPELAELLKTAARAISAAVAARAADAGARARRPRAGATAAVTVEAAPQPSPG